MGLDTTHNCWHGAYSAFNRWRVAVAKAAGVPLTLMDSYWGANPFHETIDEIIERLSAPSPFAPSSEGGFVATRDSLIKSLTVAMRLDPDTLALHSVLKDVLEWLPLSWDQLRPDIIHVLLNHSDCDGEIAAKDCGPLADRLEELLPNMPEGDGGGHIGDWQEKTKQFIKGLRKAAARKQAVKFH